MRIIFIENNEETRDIVKYEVLRKCLVNRLLVKLDKEMEFYNFKTNKYEIKDEVIIEARGIRKFIKFYLCKISEIYIISKEDNLIYTIAVLQND